MTRPTMGPDSAIIALREHRYEAAEHMARKWIDADATAAEALLTLAWAVSMQRRPAEALDPLERCLELDPDQSEALLLMARCLFRLGDYKGASLAFKRLHGRFDNYSFHYRAGRAHLAAGAIKPALFQFAAAVNLRPDATIATAYYACTACLTKSFLTARKHASALADMVLWNPLFAGTFGLLQFADREYEEAEKYLRLAAQSAPEDLVWQQYHIETLARLRRLDEANQRLDALLNAEPERPRLHYLRGLLLLSQNDPEGAQPHYETALALNGEAEAPDFREGEIEAMHLFLAKLHYENERYDDARRHLTVPVAHPSTERKAALLIGRIGLLTEQYDETANALETYSEPDGEAYDSGLALLYCLALDGLGRTNEAATLVERIVAHSPHSAEALHVLAQLRMRERRFTESENLLGRAKLLFPGLAGIDDSIALLEAKIGRPMALTGDVLHINPNHLPASFRLPEDFAGVEVKPNIWRALRVHFRILRALMERDIIGRFGRARLGYLWGILQPLLMVGTLYGAFLFLGRPVPHGTTVETFLMTGILAFYLFSDTAAQVSTSIASSKNLLYFRQVNGLSLMLSKSVLEFLSYITVFCIITSLLFMMGRDVETDNLLIVIAVLMALTVAGFCLGAVFGIASLYFPSSKHIMSIITRVMFFTSGTFFYANQLPEAIREPLLLNPIFHLIEFMRDGFFSAYDADHADLKYVATWLACGMLAALAAEKLSRQRAANL